MYETGAILIHDLSQYVELIGQLKKEQIESLLGELQQNVNNLESLNKLAVKMYKRKTGKTEEEIKNLMAQDRWILSEEALSFGLVDKVIEDAQGVKAEVKIAASKQLKNNNNKLIEMDLKAKIMEIFAAEDAPKKEETQMEEESPQSEISTEVQEVFDAMNTRLEAIEAFITELKEKMTEAEDVEIESGKGYDKEMSEKTEQIESRIENIEKRDAQIASVLDGFVTGLKQELKNQLTAQEKRIEETITALQLKENSIVTGDKTFEQKNITTAAWIDQLKQFN
jgi:enoyl-CoA hydratase/carnithine racemase